MDRMTRLFSPSPKKAVSTLEKTVKESPPAPRAEPAKDDEKASSRALRKAREKKVAAHEKSPAVPVVPRVKVAKRANLKNDELARYALGTPGKIPASPDQAPSSEVKEVTDAENRRARYFSGGKENTLAPQAPKPRQMKRKKGQVTTSTAPTLHARVAVEGNAIPSPSLKQLAKRASRNLLRQKTRIARIAADFDEASDHLGQKARRLLRAISPTKAAGAPSSVVPDKHSVLASLSFQARNQAAKAVQKISQQPDFLSGSKKEREQALYEALGSVLQGYGVDGDAPLLDALMKDVELRNRHAVIDVEIDFADEPYLSHANAGAKKFFNTWQKDSTSLPKELDAMSDDEKNQATAWFMPTFLADFYRDGVSHRIMRDDGSVQVVKSPFELADFLKPNEKSPQFCRYVSNFVSQNLMVYLQQITCGGLPGIESPVRLYDGTPIIPRGRSEYIFTYQSDGNGRVVARAELKIFADNGNNARRACQIQDAEGKRPSIHVDQEAFLSIATDLEFINSREGREWSIAPVQLHAQGWNYAEER